MNNKDFEIYTFFKFDLILIIENKKSWLINMND